MEDYGPAAQWNKLVTDHSMLVEEDGICEGMSETVAAKGNMDVVPLRRRPIRMLRIARVCK